MVAEAKCATPAPSGSAEAAQRLFAMSQPISGTLADTYLRQRGITALHGTGNLRFHPRCYYRPDEHEATETWPAMIAAVTDLAGRMTGVHRTWLAPDGSDKAPIDTPRKAMGDLLGHAVRFGMPGEVMAAGEGIESVLSRARSLPGMAMAAALSAAHLAAILSPTHCAGSTSSATMIRQATAREKPDRTGQCGRDRGDRALARPSGISTRISAQLGVEALRASIRVQLAPQDVARFMRAAA